MTLEDALQLRVGDVVIHRATMPEDRPVRVRGVWVNAKRTIVMVRLPSIDRTAWLDATGYGLPAREKVGCRWCEQHGEWEDGEVHAARHPKGLMR